MHYLKAYWKTYNSSVGGTCFWPLMILVKGDSSSYCGKWFGELALDSKTTKPQISDNVLSGVIIFWIAWHSFIAPLHHLWQTCCESQLYPVNHNDITIILNVLQLSWNGNQWWYKDSPNSLPLVSSLSQNSLLAVTCPLVSHKLKWLRIEQNRGLPFLFFWECKL